MKSVLKVRTLLLPLIVAFAVGCNGGLTGPNTCEPGDLSDGSLRAEQSLADVVFSWEGSCGVMEVAVEDSTGLQYWMIQGKPLIQAPVRYGEVPANAREHVSAVPLVPGRNYLLIVYTESSGAMLAYFRPFTFSEE